MALVVEKVVVGQISFRALWFYPISNYFIEAPFAKIID
jgi:hypothetical protein